MQQHLRQQHRAADRMRQCQLLEAPTSRDPCAAIDIVKALRQTLTCYEQPDDGAAVLHEHSDGCRVNTTAGGKVQGTTAGLHGPPATTQDKDQTTRRCGVEVQQQCLRPNP